MSVTLRVAMAADEPFFLAVYACTRAEELALVDWNAEQKAAFVSMQYQAQWTHYHTYFPEAEYLVIERDGVAIGREIVRRSDDHIQLMDIALLPQFRGAGIGTALVRHLLAEAQQSGKSVGLHVESFNRAMRLYERLGFAPVGEHGFYVEMKWFPSGSVDD